MKDMNLIEHDLRRDIHNLLSLLKFIKEEDEIQDSELKIMLEKNLEREQNIYETLGRLSQLNRVSHV